MALCRLNNMHLIQANIKKHNGMGITLAKFITESLIRKCSKNNEKLLKITKICPRYDRAQLDER